MVKQITDQLIKHGEVKRAHLGVQMQDITPALAKAFDLDSEKGAVVTSIQPDSAADEAGLKVGDIVIAIDNEALISADSLRNSIGLLMVGETIKLDIIRDGKPHVIKATVKEIENQIAENAVHPKLAGATFGDIEESSPYFGKIEGVMIYSVKRGSPAAQAGLRAGDIITSVNKRPVRDLAEFKPLAFSGGKQLLLNITRNRQAMFLILQ
jgi:serine protease Do/serine protease DegQ